MTASKQVKQRIAIAAVIAIGVVLAIAILLSKQSLPAVDANGEKNPQEASSQESGKVAKGPHGGRLFTEGDYGLEVTIFEQDVEPEFRIYTYLDGKPLDPAQSAVRLTLERLGHAPQVFKFVREDDYLKGDAVVSEPHSFKVAVSASHAGMSYGFGYEQVEARVSMTDAQLHEAGVELGTAGPARIVMTMQLLGEIRYNGDRTVQIVPRLAGRVESVAVSAGDRVRKGQLLATLSSQVLADQRGELSIAQQRLALARTTYQREKELWEEKISAEQDFLAARAVLQEAGIAVQRARQKLVALGSTPGTGDNLTRFEIRSPIDGMVTDKRISVGETLKEDSPVFVISDLSSVWVEVTIPAKDLGVIASGQKAIVRASAFAAEAEDRIAYVGALVGEQTRSAVARIVLANPKGIWRPGLPVTIDVVTEEARVPLAVSADAIQTVRDWQVVFGRYGDFLEARPLELGRSDGRHIEVLEGLQAGDRYAAKNSFLIKAELGKAGASHDH